MITSKTGRCVIIAVFDAGAVGRCWHEDLAQLNDAVFSGPRPNWRLTAGALVTSQKSTDERTKRERAIRAARHTSELEGSSNTPATRADPDAYVRGEIDVQHLDARGACPLRPEFRRSPHLDRHRSAVWSWQAGDLETRWAGYLVSPSSGVHDACHLAHNASQLGGSTGGDIVEAGGSTAAFALGHSPRMMRAAPFTRSRTMMRSAPLVSAP